MRLLAIKCQICDCWFGPFRSHCPSCGAMRIRVVNDMKREYIHLQPCNEYKPLIPMASAYDRRNWSEHALQIAQELAR